MFKEGFMSGFKGESEEEAPSASSPVTVEGVDEPGEGFISKVLAKLVGIFKGDEDSIFKGKDGSITEEIKEIKENQEEQADESGGEITGLTDETETVEEITPSGKKRRKKIKARLANKQPGGSLMETVSSTTEALSPAGSMLASTGGAAGSATGAVMESITTGGAAEALAPVGSMLTGGAAAGATGAAGAAAAAGPVGAIAAAVPVIAKIGKAVGTIVKSVGTIGLAVGKIVLKTILLSKGFKAVFNTIKQFKDDIGKIIKMALEPLNKVFKLLKKIIKPVLIAIEDILESLMKGIGKLLDSVLDVVIPLLDNILQPILNSLMPAVDTIVDILDPLFDLVGSLAEVALIPMAAQFKYVLLPWVKMIGYYLQTLMGHVEIGFGAIMIPLGAIAAGIGTVLKGIGKIPKVGKGLREAGEDLEENGNNMMETGWSMIEQGPKDIAAGIKGIVRTAVKAVMLEDQTEKEDGSTYIQNPNANEYVSPGSVLDGTVTANGNVDSHNNIWNISNVYGSGDSQKSYGNTLSMSTNGCGPMALADAYNRRTGGNVSGLSIASGMAKGGTYEPGRGTSVGSFMSASNSLGMNLKAGGVTASSLKNASPSNPVTVVGSGSDYGTKSGNNHFMNVIGTDSYGGAYVSNPLTGRVDRKSATTLASSSIMGLYGSGDTEDVYTFPDAVQSAFSKLKNIAGTILGMFTKSPSEDMRETMNKEKSAAEMERLAEDYDKMYGEGKYKEMEAEAEESAFTDWQADNPRTPGETEEAYKKRFLEQYDDSQKWKYLANSTAYQDYQKGLEDNANNTINAAKNMGEGLKKLGEERRKIKLAADDSSTTRNGKLAGGKLTADTGAELYTDEYTPTITDTNITGAGKSESPLHEFFSYMTGGRKDSSNSANTYWYSHYHSPDDEGEGSSGDTHSGIDFNMDKDVAGDDEGLPLYATTPGTVVSKIYDAGGAGNNIKWKDLGGYYHWYMHMRDEPLANVGDEIEGGQLLGYLGNTGGSDGAHLHYSIHSKEPARGDQYTVNPLTYFSNYTPPSRGNLQGSTNTEKVWAVLVNNGMSPIGAAGIMGCFQEESDMTPNNLENSYQTAMGYPAGVEGDEQYTSEVNSGQESRDNFITGRGRTNLVGYGLGQFTTSSIKQDLYDRTVGSGGRIDDLEEQVIMTLDQLDSRGLFDKISDAESPSEANNIFLRKYEAGTGFNSDAEILAAYSWMRQSDIDKRRQNAEDFYELYKDWTNTESDAASPTGKGSVITGFGMASNPADARAINNMQAIGTTDGKNTGTVKTRDGDKLALRAKPSTGADSNVLVWIPNGTKLNLETSDTKGWFKTSYDGKDGFVSSSYISLDVANTNTNPNMYKQNNTTPNVNKQNNTTADDKRNEEIRAEYTKYFAGKQDPWNVFIPSVYPSKTDSQRWAAYGILGDEWRGTNWVSSK